MPNYSSIISKAVELVTQTLAGMDSEAIAHFIRILREEAQIISEDLIYSGQHVKLDILTARLHGLLKRMKYEVFYKVLYLYLSRIYIFLFFLKKGPDLSPSEFPIFNVSHNSSAAYPNPINHLYDTHYQQVPERVVIIDRHDSNSSTSGKGRLRTSKNHISTTSAVLTTLSIGYNIQQPRSYMSMSNNIYSTTTTSYYPFVDYRY
jgi:hypothetical protein